MLRDPIGDGEATYDELKSLCSKTEWAQERMGIIKNMPEWVDKIHYYVREGFYDEALERLRHSPTLMLLRLYGLKLAKKYPAEVIEIYRRVLDPEAEHCGGRPHYRELAWHLRRLRQIEGGEGVARKLVEEWQRRYPGGRAMREEVERGIEN